MAAQFAATTPTYFYQFDDEDAPAQNNDLPGFVGGAAHGEELGFLWPSFALALGDPPSRGRRFDVGEDGPGAGPAIFTSASRSCWPRSQRSPSLKHSSLSRCRTLSATATSSGKPRAS